ncbi:MAG: hypothetical protein M1831_001522 [Alyxoria varia]|nr:MAG: hypothetical protein M1831_001522 [Alyxoria varia]
MVATTEQVITNSVTWALFVLSTFVILLRLWARLRLKPHFGWDDVAIIGSQAVNLALSITISLAVASGTGKSIEDIPPQDIPYAIKINTIANAISIMSFPLPKIAIAIMLTRILSLNKITTCLFIVPAVIMNLYALAHVAIFVVYATIDPTLVVNSAITVSAMSAFTDLYYGACPIYFISRLQMALQRKVAISVMFALGIISCVVACYKCTKLTVLKNRNVNLTYSSAPLMYWTSIEANIVTIAACVPTLGPIFTIFWRRSDTYLSKSKYARRGHESYHQFSAGEEPTTDNKRGANVQSKSIDSIELAEPHSPDGDGFDAESQRRLHPRTGKAMDHYNLHGADGGDGVLGGGAPAGHAGDVAAAEEEHGRVATGGAVDGITKRVEMSVSEEYNAADAPRPARRHGNSTHAPNFSTPEGWRTGNVSVEEGTTGQKPY